MLTQAQRKFVINLQQKKARKEQGVFVAEGDKIIRELLESPFEVLGLYGTEAALDELGSLASRSHSIYKASNSDMERISNLKTPNKVLAVARKPMQQEQLPVATGQIILALDSIQDPGNMGTIIRTADWFGIQQIVCSHFTVDLFNPKVIQASMGSFLRVKVHYTDLEEYLYSNSSTTSILGAFPDGSDVFMESAPGSAILVVGNESAGISSRLLPLIHKRIAIPGCNQQRGKTSAESLNAAVAAAILMLWVTGKHLPVYNR